MTHSADQDPGPSRRFWLGPGVASIDSEGAWVPAKPGDIFAWSISID